MIAEALIAASVLAPSGVTATIQADPVCLNVPARPGTAYDLPVYAAGPVTLSVTPAHGALERTLHQVQPSWVRVVPGQGPGAFLLVLTVPSGAAPGAYWSDVMAAAGSQAQSAQASLGAAATTALVFTVGSSVAPPPCSELDVAQSTGQFPAWPTDRFATSSWQQVFAREKQDEPMPYTSPTAGTGPVSAPSGQYAPASPAASQGSAGSDGKTAGVVLIGIVALCALGLLRRRSS